MEKRYASVITQTPVAGSEAVYLAADVEKRLDERKADYDHEKVMRAQAEGRVAELELANKGLMAVLKKCECPSCVAWRNSELMER